MEALFWIAGFIVFLILMYWYIEVYTPKKHMHEAVQEANAMMQRYGPRPPR